MSTTRCSMEKVVIHGTVMRMDASNAEVINHGTIMHLSGSNLSIRNNGTIMHGVEPTKIIYRDRVRNCYRTDPEQEKTIKMLESELERTRTKLEKAYKEIETLRQHLAEMSDIPREEEDLRHTKELLEYALEVNRESARRIRELERGVCDRYLQRQIDPWDIKPTKAQCAELLDTFNSYIETEEEGL